MINEKKTKHNDEYPYSEPNETCYSPKVYVLAQQSEANTHTRHQHAHHQTSYIKSSSVIKAPPVSFSLSVCLPLTCVRAVSGESASAQHETALIEKSLESGASCDCLKRK